MSGRCSQCKRGDRLEEEAAYDAYLDEDGRSTRRARRPGDGVAIREEVEFVDPEAVDPGGEPERSGGIEDVEPELQAGGTMSGCAPASSSRPEPPVIFIDPLAITDTFIPDGGGFWYIACNGQCMPIPQRPRPSGGDADFIVEFGRDTWFEESFDKDRTGADAGRLGSGPCGTSGTNDRCMSVVAKRWGIHYPQERIRGKKEVGRRTRDLRAKRYRISFAVDIDYQEWN